MLLHDVKDCVLQSCVPVAHSSTSVSHSEPVQLFRQLQEPVTRSHVCVELLVCSVVQLHVPVQLYPNVFEGQAMNNKMREN